MRKAQILLLTGLLACGDDEDRPNTPPVASFEYYDDVDRIVLDGDAKDKDGDPLTYFWSSDGSISIVNETLGESYFKIPDAAAGEVEITLAVSDGKSRATKTQAVNVPPFSLVRSYGLGKSLDNEVSNDLDYEWYIDQANSGTHSLLNCGPASVTMAIKWFNKNFSGTAEDARNVYHSSGGWWYTNDIIAYLNMHGTANRTIQLDQISNLMTEIDAGNVIILCLDMFLVDDHKDLDHHVGKFYATNGVGWGHFIVVKGYKEVDGKVFYETYDPYSFNRYYSTGGLKGKDRYYSSANLDKATDHWWDYAIVVGRSDSPGGRKGVDVSKIIHKPGR